LLKKGRYNEVQIAWKEVIVGMDVRRGHPPVGYLTATQAKKRLGGISDGKFRSYIHEGKIERLVPPGMKQGFYKREDVEKLAREIDSFWESGAIAPRTQFHMAAPEDIPAIAAIDEKTFNTGKEDAEPKEVYRRWIEKTYRRWMTKNPQVFFVLRNSANKVVGFAALLPMKKETMDRFVRGEIGMADIPSDDVDLFEPGKPLHVYIIALCIDPAYKAATKEEYGAMMVRGLFAHLLELAQRGVEIETITARNEKDKPDGKRLLQKLGMPQLRSPVADMFLFSVRVADSGYSLLMKYSDTLAAWKREHPVSP
jgi:hypothetical protein